MCACGDIYMFVVGVEFNGDCELSLVVHQILDTQKPWLTCECAHHSAKRLLPRATVGMVVLLLLFGSLMVMVWFSLWKLHTTDCVRMLNGRPSRISYAGEWRMWTCRYRVISPTRKEMFRASPSDCVTIRTYTTNFIYFYMY